MNDTNKQILGIFNTDTALSSSQIHKSLNSVSLVTIKRRLSELTELELLTQTGAGRSVKYSLSKKGMLLRPIDVDSYLSQDPDTRNENTSFSFSVLKKPYIDLFTAEELKELEVATSSYRANAKNIDATIQAKELQRFIVEFSWKTSQIEGNTYDLISTERLLRYGEKSKSNTEHEAQMIINQKEALEFILSDLSQWRSPTVTQLEDLHSIVGKNLGISRNLRKGLVGITGTNYRPLDNQFQIKEALDELFQWVQEAQNVYEKSLLCVLGISYIQPFVDGNKRISRLLSNAVLLSNDYAPLSYRSVDDRRYKEATLVFYEQNSVVPFKKLFVDQYTFSANNYNIYQIDKK
ncbi:MAG: Fic family protein [Candidatus Paceibacterota bacterium]